MKPDPAGIDRRLDEKGMDILIMVVPVVDEQPLYELILFLVPAHEVHYYVLVVALGYFLR